MGYPKDVKRHDADKYHKVWSALDRVINAWESLEGGRGHSPIAVEQWLNKVMAPAIRNARTAMGRKAPHGHD